MSAVHKEALAQGRREGAAVRAYLTALDEHKPRRGRQRTRESVQRRKDEVEAIISDAAPMERLHLVQERMDLDVELAEMDARENTDLSALEEEFVEIAASYAERKGISYAAFRELNVPAATLRAAGVKRTAA